MLLGIKVKGRGSEGGGITLGLFGLCKWNIVLDGVGVIVHRRGLLGLLILLLGCLVLLSGS